jgi:hypothetical protein
MQTTDPQKYKIEVIAGEDPDIEMTDMSLE